MTKKKFFYVLFASLFLLGGLLSYSARLFLQHKQFPQYHFESNTDRQLQQLIKDQISPAWLPNDAQNISLQYCYDKPLCLWLKFDSQQVKDLINDLGLVEKPISMMRMPKFLPPFSIFSTRTVFSHTSGTFFEGPVLFDGMRGYFFIAPTSEYNKAFQTLYYWIE